METQREIQSEIQIHEAMDRVRPGETLRAKQTQQNQEQQRPWGQKVGGDTVASAPNSPCPGPAWRVDRTGKAGKEAPPIMPCTRLQTHTGTQLHSW